MNLKLSDYCMINNRRKYMIKKFGVGGLFLQPHKPQQKIKKREGDYGNIIHFSRKIGGVA